MKNVIFKAGGKTFTSYTEVLVYARTHKLRIFNSDTIIYKGQTVVIVTIGKP